MINEGAESQQPVGFSSSKCTSDAYGLIRMGLDLYGPADGSPDHGNWSYHLKEGQSDLAVSVDPDC